MARNNHRDRTNPAGPEAAFVCENCSLVVPPPDSGSMHRNHCPWCLHSLHVDLTIGDRRNGCKGLMAPISVWVRPDGEWAVIHRCTRCKALRINRVAGDDAELALMALALKPLARPPFPLDRLAERMGHEA